MKWPGFCKRLFFVPKHFIPSKKKRRQYYHVTKVEGDISPKTAVFINVKSKYDQDLASRQKFHRNDPLGRTQSNFY